MFRWEVTCVSHFQPIRAYNLGHKGWKNLFYTHFAPPHHCAMLTKHFDLTQVSISLFSNLERGNGDADTHSIGITVVFNFFASFQHNLTMVV